MPREQRRRYDAGVVGRFLGECQGAADVLLRAVRRLPGERGEHLGPQGTPQTGARSSRSTTSRPESPVPTPARCGPRAAAARRSGAS
ncbi:hypothetical protein [Streptomyces sp. NPDC094032]|uniref:hypothetical protein n=1 Tax=Streptomyces sp. NPDC094032 TaxID=3155308 RepID=UPI0033278D7F